MKEGTFEGFSKFFAIVSRGWNDVGDSESGHFSVAREFRREVAAGEQVREFGQFRPSLRIRFAPVSFPISLPFRFGFFLVFRFFLHSVSVSDVFPPRKA